MYENTEAVRLNRSIALNTAAALDVVARSAASAAQRLRVETQASSPQAFHGAARPRDRVGPMVGGLHMDDTHRVWRLK